MKTSTVAILSACGIVAIAGGWYVRSVTTPAEEAGLPPGGLMFPDLASSLPRAAKLEITHQDKHLVIEKRPDATWGVASLHDYPVQESRLRGLLTGLTELRLTEPRTADPTEFSRIGVDDPAGKDASGNLLQLADSAGSPIVAVIIGHRRVRSQGSGMDEVYVRRPTENQSWLATGSIQADVDPQLWLDRSIVNIAPNRIATVTVGEKALMLARVDGKLAVTEPTDHPKLEDYKVDDVGRGLELLTFQTVKADADVTATDAGSSVFTTTDGLAVTVHVLHAEKDVWARFSAAGNDATKTEADRLNKRLAGWSYQIGSWKEKSLVPTLSDLKAAEPEKPAVSAPAGPSSDATPQGAMNSGNPTPGVPSADAGSDGFPSAEAPSSAPTGPAAPAADADSRSK